MNQVIRGAVARIDVMQAGKSISRGTGCLVGEGLVLTAFHVVADRRQDPPAALYSGEITLTFPNLTTKATLHGIYWDRISDWALLKCEETPPARPVPLAILEKSGGGWETYGFPDANPRDGMVQLGSVTNYLGELENCRVMQLFSDQAAAGGGAPVKGLSGGPVFVEGALVGVLRFALMKEGMTVAGTLYACPVPTVLEKCSDLLPIPDPCFGLPGLPRQPLPSNPFRYLARFTSKDAEVFFGRNREIRQLHERLTATDASSLTLLYGQSGVGKSSFLDAGVVPRLQWNFETLYLRRDAQRSLLDTLQQALEPGDGLTARWLASEKHAGKPLVVFFDQIEECYMLPCAAAPNEVGEFIAAIKTLPGRLVLSFRKEWFPEIQKKVEDAGIDYGKVFLEAVDHDAIVEIVTGLTRTQRLRDFYNLTIDADLPETIAHDLADRNSPIAPTLQILLTKLWRSAIATNARAPRIHEELYRQLREDGLLLGDFLDQQLEELAKDEAGVVESGLVLDVLAYHTTPLLTAQQRSQNELVQTYANHSQTVPALFQNLERLYLLSDASLDTGGKATRLTHDTLAPVVRSRFDGSDKTGQRARRIMESRVDDWDGSDQNALDGASLTIVESGLAGMRALKPREQALLDASRRKDARERRRTRVARSAAIAAVTFIAVLAVMASVFYLRANQDKAIAELELRAATAQNVFAVRPLGALLRAIAVTGDSLRSENSVLPLVQRSLAATMTEALETNRIPSANTAVALSPDGLTLALGRLIEDREQVTFWDRRGANIGAIPDFPANPQLLIAPLAFGPDGNLLVIGGSGLRVWNREKQTLQGPFVDDHSQTNLEVLAVAFTPDGDLLLSGHNDGMLRVWTLGGQLVTSVRADDGLRLRGQDRAAQTRTGASPNGATAPSAGKVSAIATQRGPNGEIFAVTGGDDGFVRQWQLKGRELTPLNKLDGSPGQIGCLAMRLRGGKLVIASGSSSGKMLIWNDGQESTPYYFTKPVKTIAISPKEDLVAAAAEAATIRFSNLSADRIASDFQGFQDLAVVHSLAFAPDGSLVAGVPGSVRFLDTARLGGARHIAALDANVVGVDFLPGGALVAGTVFGDLNFWYPETDSVHRIEHAQDGPLSAVATNRQGSLIAGGGPDGRIRLFDVQGNTTVELSPGSCMISRMTFSPDGKTLAVLCGNSDLTLWDIPSKKQRAVIHDGATAFAFTGSGDLLATIGSARGIRLWRLDGSEGDPSRIQPNTGARALAFRPDGMGLLIGHDNGTVARWLIAGDTDNKPLELSKGTIVSLWIDQKSEKMFAVTSLGVGAGTYPKELNAVPEAITGFETPLRIDSASLSLEENAIVTVGSGGVRLWPVDWRITLKESCLRLRNHLAFQDPRYAPLVDASEITRAHQVCQAEMWR